MLRGALPMLLRPCGAACADRRRVKPQPWFSPIAPASFPALQRAGMLVHQAISRPAGWWASRGVGAPIPRGLRLSCEIVQGTLLTSLGTYGFCLPACRLPLLRHAPEDLSVRLLAPGREYAHQLLRARLAWSVAQRCPAGAEDARPQPQQVWPGTGTPAQYQW